MEQVRAPHMLPVETSVRGLVTSNEENGSAARIEGVEDSNRRPRLDSELAHVAVAVRWSRFVGQFRGSAKVCSMA